MLRRVLLLLLALPLAAVAGPHRSYLATVGHVTDGDTLWVQPSWGGPRIELRIQGIDAPEICQAWGPQARDALLQQLRSQTVTVEERARDTYGRVLARVHWAGQDVGAWLVFNGLAWSPRYRRYPGAYEALQAQAQQARRGLWSQAQPLEPRRFRRQHGPCPHPPAQ